MSSYLNDLRELSFEEHSPSSTIPAPPRAPMPETTTETAAAPPPPSAMTAIEAVEAMTATQAAQTWKALLSDAMDETKFPPVQPTRSPFKHFQAFLHAKAKGDYNDGKPWFPFPLLSPLKEANHIPYDSQSDAVSDGRHPSTGGDHPRPPSSPPHAVGADRRSVGRGLPGLYKGWKNGTEVERRLAVLGLVHLSVSIWATRYDG